ncbi:hypothetical protein GCM10010211_65060 [Streptomyces albospinus]|uniref:Homing endonuclease LAGLIDADG domain-containing protein n=1 Tax=Streptomyces albospinus TaxID=285515 RepID=A0ABQ2VIR6_9ACTN|nr:hypothetical protein GCM10010211_65060 [Streptomyces albospinus]
MLKILLNAGNSSEIAYDLILITLLITYVKIAVTWRQSAGVRSISTSEASQRLDAENLIYAYLVGFIEGDGYFTVTKNGLYVKYELGIELSIKDVELLYKIKKLLGVGVISFRKRDNGSEMVLFRIKNKDHLKKYILPIFDLYPMLSNKQYDYLFFRKSLLSNIIYSNDLPEYNRIIEPSLNNVDSILNAHYFEAWLVGFIEGEGCFSIYNTAKNKSLESSIYLTASFEISQTNGNVIISAIVKYLSFKTAIYIDKTNSSKLKVTGIRSIENIIKFLDKAPVKLMGNKKLQYLLWIKALRQIKRYSDKINIPSNY